MDLSWKALRVRSLHRLGSSPQQLRCTPDAMPRFLADPPPSNACKWLAFGMRAAMRSDHCTNCRSGLRTFSHWQLYMIHKASTASFPANCCASHADGIGFGTSCSSAHGWDEAKNTRVAQIAHSPETPLEKRNDFASLVSRVTNVPGWNPKPQPPF